VTRASASLMDEYASTLAERPFAVAVALLAVLWLLLTKYQGKSSELKLDSRPADADAMQRARALQQERLDAAAQAAAAARQPQREARAPAPAAPAAPSASESASQKRLPASDPNSYTSRLAKLEKGKEPQSDPLRGYDTGGGSKSVVSRRKGG